MSRTASKYVALRRAASGGNVLAEAAKELVDNEVAAFVARCNEKHVVAPNEKVLIETVSALVIDASPWLQNAVAPRPRRRA